MRWVKKVWKTLIEEFGNGPSTKEGWEAAAVEAGEARRIAEIEICQRFGRFDLATSLRDQPPGTYASDEQLIEVEGLSPDALQLMDKRTEELLRARWKLEGKPWQRSS